MGVLYSVLALDSTITKWLCREGVFHPPPSATFRLPTPREIAEVFPRLPGFTTEIVLNTTAGEVHKIELKERAILQENLEAIVQAAPDVFAGAVATLPLRIHLHT
jgi:hypothetical protein